MNQLLDFILSDRRLEIDFDRAPYKSIVKALRGQNNFIDLTYEAILPEIKGFQGKLITTQELHKIRLMQSSISTIWDDPYAGYLDFVTHVHDFDYLRPYVGQAGIPRDRLSQHHTAIRNGSERTLHYWIIKIGHGLRVANFIRLWTMTFPANIDNLAQLSFQAAPPRLADIRVLREATQALIRGSHLRIVIICGDRAEQVAIPDDAESKRVEITLQGRKYNVWVEIQQSRIKRLFIRSRQPLSRLWATQGRQAFDLTNIFRFSSIMMDIKIFGGFYESALSVSLIVRKWTDERDNGLPRAKPADLEPILKVWLANRSFQSHEDLDRLTKAAGGSLRYGVLVLSLIQPKEKHSTRVRRILPSIQRRRGAIPRQVIDDVKLLWTELAGESGAGQSGAPSEEADDVDEDDIEKAAEEFGISKQPEYVASGAIQDSEISDQDGLDRPTPCFDNRLVWLLGTKYKGAKSSENTVRMEIWIKAELSPIGERHPNIFATMATASDPASRLAIRCSFEDTYSGQTKVVYAHTPTRSMLCKANTLVDELNGDDFVEICQRPRRFMETSTEGREESDAQETEINAHQD
ncbi:hypothetical protein PENNAL_c0012G00165 [Penicillium nalgiovense]|uniref:Uncharacterized protein n=1 Tax=Penicillium nalgiovense TaxID=60175 RepID=A0A1V6YSG0_PENNA|nr:hypothetical protein PENNAL_c0012G00165 [Penicillium nalgiovense]